MPIAGPWLPLVVLGSGVISAYFIRYLWPYRHTPGAWFFIGTIAAETLWALSYGVALFVFDPALRWLFEIPIWLGIDFIGVFFLAFALEYTGRSHLVRSPLMGVVVLLQLLHTAIVATNPIHHVAWSNYHIEPVFGAATVSYTHQPWLFVNLAGIYLMVASASFLLFDTFFSYGPLYRAQAAAVALSPVLPGLAFLLWVFEVGVSPPLNLTPLTFPVHLGFDMYAFFRRNMFEMTPSTRRASERAAIEDLGSAVVVVNDEWRIINLNGEARRVLAVESTEALGRRLDAVLSGIDLSAEKQTVSIATGGERREYAVTTSSLDDATGNHVGYTVVLQDITTEKQRQQRLAVLNRVLRHNLRNDLNVVLASIDMAGQRTDDEDVRDVLRTAEEKTKRVLGLGEKARRIDRMMTDGATTKQVRVCDVLEDVTADLQRSLQGTIDVRVPDDLRLRANPELLDGVFRNLIENAVEHSDADEPLVEVVLVERNADGEWATVEVRDDGPGIPEHELAAIEKGDETPLEHGSGLGLWLVEWGVTSLGGEISFETGAEGTTATLKLPIVVDDETP